MRRTLTVDSMRHLDRAVHAGHYRYLAGRSCFYCLCLADGLAGAVGVCGFQAPFASSNLAEELADTDSNTALAAEN